MFDLMKMAGTLNKINPRAMWSYAYKDMGFPGPARGGSIPMVTAVSDLQ